MSAFICHQHQANMLGDGGVINISLPISICDRFQDKNFFRKKMKIIQKNYKNSISLKILWPHIFVRFALSLNRIKDNFFRKKWQNSQFWHFQSMVPLHTRTLVIPSFRPFGSISYHFRDKNFFWKISPNYEIFKVWCSFIQWPLWSKFFVRFALISYRFRDTVKLLMLAGYLGWLIWRNWKKTPN